MWKQFFLFDFRRTDKLIIKRYLIFCACKVLMFVIFAWVIYDIRRDLFIANAFAYWLNYPLKRNFSNTFDSYPTRWFFIDSWIQLLGPLLLHKFDQPWEKVLNLFMCEPNMLARHFKNILGYRPGRLIRFFSVAGGYILITLSCVGAKKNQQRITTVSSCCLRTCVFHVLLCMGKQ